VLLAVALGACAGPAVSLPPPTLDTTGPVRDVCVVRHGWHTRVAMRVADVDPGRWPESRAIGDGVYVEVGWGDRDFYTTPHPSALDAVDPVIRATPAALHVGLLDARPDQIFARDDVVCLGVTAAGLEQLVRFIDGHHVRDAQARPVRIGGGFYPRSAFYEARGRYHAFTYNSNTWTLSALRAAGLAVDPAFVVTSAAVMRQAAAISAPR
jgi:uncharacterized protein (TIGR02117 family)